MKLAEEIVIQIAGEDIVLHPALRFAIRLERREGSFRQLVADINEGSLTAALDIIEPHTDLPFLKNRVFDVLSTLRVPLLAYVMACAGIDEAQAPSEGKAAGTAKSVPFADHLAQLYRFATGWIGWTPETTLDATPAEIIEAYRGRTEMLKAIFGGGEKETPKDDRPLDEKFRSLFASHGTVKGEE